MNIKLLIILCFTLLISACGDERQERIDSNINSADYLINALGQSLDNKNIRNAMLLEQYASLLADEKPELSPLLEQLSRDATREGPTYQGLVQRLKTMREQPQVVGDIEAQLFETETLIEASDPALFNDALSDPINVIADMSDGKLARVNAISKQQSLQANGAEDNGAGSQLVGNPGYGQWQTDSSGMSFWHWYGMYAMFSAITNPVRYDRWSSRRDYSYYNDVGRNRYTSPQQTKSQNDLANKTKKQFGNNRGFQSPYGKSKTGASAMSNSSRQAQKSTPFSGRSSYSKARAQSKASSSFRNSKTTSSRGTRRGK
ncbi:hypothetical protein CW745_03935 [Psychromonas sp. psych-6C06]|uniref:hypothetical protein n=1 Tax=Psychromonas sp. psych-6C06 TaxID=2058089 RepID=UPI000C3239B7|nr:hypothetical protein [Psychromonas sp. psych-6C06]PKF62581.1 hypothetical protein CW745_03935 [Psychromonas sp. psych-6C06]